MIEVFKIDYNYYDSEYAVKLNFNTLNTTRGNVYKLQKFMCHYNTRKYSFCARVVNIWNSLPNEFVCDRNAMYDAGQGFFNVQFNTKCAVLTESVQL